jgi:hypothetical protein
MPRGRFDITSPIQLTNEKAVVSLSVSSISSAAGLYADASGPT